MDNTPGVQTSGSMSIYLLHPTMKHNHNGNEREWNACMNVDDFCRYNHDELCIIYEQSESEKGRPPQGDRQDHHHFISWCYEYVDDIMNEIYSINKRL